MGHVTVQALADRLTVCMPSVDSRALNSSDLFVCIYEIEIA